jgi:hypothetical protein
MYPLYLPSSFLWNLQCLTHLSGWTVQKALARSTCCSLHTNQRPRAGFGKSFRRRAPARTPMAYARPAIGSAAVTAAARRAGRSTYRRGIGMKAAGASLPYTSHGSDDAFRHTSEAHGTPRKPLRLLRMVKVSAGADVCCLSVSGALGRRRAIPSESGRLYRAAWTLRIA